MSGIPRSNRAYGLVVVAALWLCTAGHLCRAQETVKANGQTTLSRPADHLHLEVQLRAHGKDVKEAIDKLKNAEAEVVKKLTAVQEAKPDFDPPRMESEDDPQKNYARMMAGLGNQGRKKMPPPQGVSVTTTMHCDWDLKGATPDEIALTAYELQEKLRAANPWKTAEDNDLRAQQEEEAAEENAGANPFAAAAARPGQPTFSYTATFTADELTKASTEALESARQQATQLAKAAGKSLGDLRELESQKNAQVAANPNNPMSEYIAMMQTMSAPKTAHVGPDVAVGDQPGVVTLQLFVTATFQLK